MLAMLILSGEALLFLRSLFRWRLCERLLGRTLFLRSGIPGAWLRCSAGKLCDRDSEGSGELRLDTSLSVGEEDVEVEAAGCRAVVLISESGCGGAGAFAAAGAGISALLAMGQVALTRASEIEARLNANLEAQEQSHGSGAHGTDTLSALHACYGGRRCGREASRAQTGIAIAIACCVSLTAGCSCQHRPETAHSLA